MIGVGHAFGAVSFVNALATGVGCAGAIALTADARVVLERARRGSAGSISIAPPSNTPLVRATLLESLQRFGQGTDYEVELSLDSRVPVARGLKSSSAVSTAVAAAVAEACRRTVSRVELASLSADVSHDIRLSATGAFDDALAACAGGIVVTDNQRRVVLRAGTADPNWSVALWVPRARHASSHDWREKFSARAAEGRAAAEAAARGDYLAAMARNTELVERIVGYDYRPLREELRRQGAVGSGVSGMGPTLAVIVPRERLAAVKAALPKGDAEVASADFVPPLPGGPA